MVKLKIMAQNIFGPFIYKIGSRLEKIKDYIKLVSCDFVSLQEVIFFSYLDRLNKKYYRIYKNGRIGPKGGLVILSKIKPDSVEFYKFNEQGSWFNGQVTDRIIEKGFLVARFGNITFVNTHLVDIYGKKDEHKNHVYLRRQFNQLLYFLKNEKKTGQKIILAADLNFTPSFNSYKYLSSFLYDHTNGIENELKTTRGYRRQTDYVWSSFDFIKGSVSKIEYPIFVSDHPGVLVELTFEVENEIEKVLKPADFF